MEHDFNNGWNPISIPPPHAEDRVYSSFLGLLEALGLPQAWPYPARFFSLFTPIGGIFHQGDSFATPTLEHNFIIHFTNVQVRVMIAMKSPETGYAINDYRFIPK